MAVVVKQWQEDIDTTGHLDPPLVTDTVHAGLISPPLRLTLV